MGKKNIVFVGILASSDSLEKLKINYGYIAIEQGKITKTGSIKEFERLAESGTFSGYQIIKLSANQFIIPGFVDCHTHAPQFPNIGLGLDRPLLEWLAKYTFPLEKRYKDTEFAAKVYDQVVQRLLRNGTTTACYFGSLHVDGTLELVKSAIKHHQRALIGKVSMNKENDAGYYNNTKQELADVETFVKSVISYQNELVEPVVTPRFAVSCDKELMDGLSEIANKYNSKIQSHISENLSEIEYVLQTNPDCKSYGDVYNKSQILNNRCIMAHAVHLTDEELTLLSAKGVSVAHCPASNTRLKSGLCPVRRIIDSNITVGLGTDVAGGDNASILDAIRRTMDVSTCLEMQGRPKYSLNWREAFYLATLGGAQALNLGDRIGNFDVGKDFDALLVDVYAKGSQIDQFAGALEKTDDEHAVELLEKFIFLGDDRNIVQVYVKGNLVKDTL
ncbi:guanine deaminase-like [Trichoplusia ni]|uniref:Guanine deaminase n=1 Tax=Trichoplusia ni TaxID=7111 RepID=A0A7E5W3W7_TRINI|nr:guanine deaminase-like [Trichoplusia ni]